MSKCETINIFLKMNEKSSDVIEYIRDLSECPVCLDSIKSAPIHQCTNGHVICKDCILKLENCPICRSGSKMARNLMLEQIIAKIYGPQQEKEGPYEKSKLEEWGHGSASVHFSNDGLIEEPTIQLNVASNLQHSTMDVESIRKFFKFIGIAIIVCILIGILLGCIYALYVFIDIANKI